jgi:hypothetical protein
MMGSWRWKETVFIFSTLCTHARAWLRHPYPEPLINNVSRDGLKRLFASRAGLGGGESAPITPCANQLFMGLLFEQLLAVTASHFQPGDLPVSLLPRGFRSIHWSPPIVDGVREQHVSVTLRSPSLSCHKLCRRNTWGAITDRSESCSLQHREFNRQ